MKSILSVGMDVHKNSFSLCAYDGYTGEIVSESTFASDVKLVIKFIETLKSRYENDVEIKCGYEAGCLGYSLYKSLTARGVDCVILAPTTMQVSAKNKRRLLHESPTFLFCKFHHRKPESVLI